VQEDTEKTIEAVLFDALLKTRLIESRATANYHRCGRTDKGVSAFSQVTNATAHSHVISVCLYTHDLLCFRVLLCHAFLCFLKNDNNNNKKKLSKYN